MVDIEGYAILVVRTMEEEIRLFGSPADRADLEVGDEIIEVNGQNLEGYSHAQIIAHIHECIKSRTIKLKVKRKAKGVNIVPELNQIQDAYVIAVEDQARQRLERLSSLHKVNPIDISQVQRVLDIGNNNVESVVTETKKYSPAHSAGQDELSEAELALESCPNAVAGTARLSDPALPLLNQLGSLCQADRELQDAIDRELISHERGDKEDSDCASGGLVCRGDVESLDDFEESISNQEECNSETDIKEVISGEKRLESESIAEDDTTSVKVVGEEENESVTMDTSVINGYADHHHGGGIANYRYSNNYNSSQENMYQSVDPHHSTDESDIAEPGTHREMAIDCPPSFVGVRKEPPRYPPRQGHQSSPRSRPVSTTSSPRKEPVAMGVPNPYDNSVTYQPPPMMTKEEHMEHLQRIRKYQEDLKKRREEEERINQEEEFLRTSLRGSKKLQALEETKWLPPPSGIINPTYISEEDPHDVLGKSATLPVARVQKQDGLQRPVGVEDLFSSVKHIQNRLRNAEDQKEVTVLLRLFQNTKFQQALRIHNKVVDVCMRETTLNPVADDSHGLSGDILGTLSAQPHNATTDELSRLLQSPHFKGLLLTHDQVALQRAEPLKTTTEEDEREYLYERASQYGEDSIKIVRLQKTADPLGATVKNENDSVVIGRIVKGGAAEKSGLLHEGDEILEINGMDIRGQDVNNVCDLMANLTGTLTFLIIPSQELVENSGPDKVMHVKAHFDYDPEDDTYIPCRELGISFQKGDLLHVINQDDPNWWQAYREGEDDQNLAGLIPSRSFQEQLEAMKQTIVAEANKRNKKKNRCRCGLGRHKKDKKMYTASGDDLDAEEILTYEEVALYYPQPNRKRPVVLIGPSNVGRKELRQRLMDSDPSRFAAAVPHTSRPKKEDEVDGLHYHFVSRPLLEEDIANHRFVEYGEYEKHLYGTSIEATRQVVNSGKICVLSLHPQSLRILKASDLKPFVVFISPPNIEKLKELCRKQGLLISDDELRETIEKGREMDENYGHYFDRILINYDMDKCYAELRKEINALELEPQWVPSVWLT